MKDKETIYCDHCGDVIDDSEDAFEDADSMYCCEDCMIAGQDWDIIDA